MEGTIFMNFPKTWTFIFAEGRKEALVRNIIKIAALVKIFSTRAYRYKQTGPPMLPKNCSNYCGNGIEADGRHSIAEAFQDSYEKPPKKQAAILCKIIVKAVALWKDIFYWRQTYFKLIKITLAQPKNVLEQAIYCKVEERIDQKLRKTPSRFKQN